MKKLPQVNFLPFRGRSYGYQSAFGIPVLVLGESHYNDNGRQSFPPSFTCDVMDDVISGEEWKFFTQVLATFCGEQAVDPKTFWNSVAFYNFIQTVIKKNTRAAASSTSPLLMPTLPIRAPTRRGTDLKGGFSGKSKENSRADQHDQRHDEKSVQRSRRHHDRTLDRQRSIFWSRPFHGQSRRPSDARELGCSSPTSRVYSPSGWFASAEAQQHGIGGEWRVSDREHRHDG